MADPPPRPTSRTRGSLHPGNLLLALLRRLLYCVGVSRAVR